METSALLPLLGVFLGWLLKELSDYLRGRSAARSGLGLALVDLLQLEAELTRLRLALDFQKSRPISWEEYEAIRVAVATRHLTRTDPARAVSAAVAVLAQYNPVQAATLRDVAPLLASFPAVHLETLAAGESEHLYVKCLSTLEVAVDVAGRALERFILALARLHGPLTWLRVKTHWRRGRSTLAAENRNYVEALLRDLHASAPPPPSIPTASAVAAAGPQSPTSTLDA